MVFRRRCVIVPPPRFPSRLITACLFQIKDLNAAKAKLPYKSVQDVDDRIKYGRQFSMSEPPHLCFTGSLTSRLSRAA